MSSNLPFVLDAKFSAAPPVMWRSKVSYHATLEEAQAAAVKIRGARSVSIKTRSGKGWKKLPLK